MPGPSHAVKFAALQEAYDRGFLVAYAPGERILVRTLAADLTLWAANSRAATRFIATRGLAKRAGEFEVVRICPRLSS